MEGARASRSATGRLCDRVITPDALSTVVFIGSPADVGYLTTRGTTRILRSGIACRRGAHWNQRIIVVNAWPTTSKRLQIKPSRVDSTSGSDIRAQGIAAARIIRLIDASVRVPRSKLKKRIFCGLAELGSYRDWAFALGTLYLIYKSEC
jgi:hypothetical protein